MNSFIVGYPFWLAPSEKRSSDRLNEAAFAAEEDRAGNPVDSELASVID